MCPACRQPLIIVEFQGVEVDHCPGCRGTWFDAGELELIAELAGAASGRLGQALGDAGAGTTGKRRCPRCRRKLRVVTLGGARPVEVDCCPAGDGLWLDAGELRAVVASFAEGGEGVIARFFGDLFRHELAAQPEEE